MNILKKSISIAAIFLFIANVTHAAVVESFESGSWGAGWSNPSAGNVNTNAAHDGDYGVTMDAADWTYNGSILFPAGDTMSVWVRPTSGSSGRAYLGFEADATGAYSFDLATNTNELLFQDNSGYGFNNINSSSQKFNNGSWYFVTITRSSDGLSATADLYAADGVTLINSLTQGGMSKAANGIALRGFGGFDLDTVSVSSVPEPASIALLGLGLLGVAASRRRKQ